jgi:hypothetical protein
MTLFGRAGTGTLRIAIGAAGRGMSDRIPKKGGARLCPNRALLRAAMQYSRFARKNNGKTRPGAHICTAPGQIFAF